MKKEIEELKLNSDIFPESGEINELKSTIKPIETEKESFSFHSTQENATVKEEEQAEETLIEKKMRRYELDYFLIPKLSQEEVFGFLQKIENILKELGKIFEVSKIPQIKRIAYPFRKHGQGYYGEIKFLMEPEKISDLERKLRLEKEILRFTIFSLPEISPKVVERPLRKPKSLFKKKPEVPSLKVSEEREKVRLEEIDKKLDEILGEI